jgi:hypothetical protein
MLDIFLEGDHPRIISTKFSNVVACTSAPGNWALAIS